MVSTLMITVGASLWNRLPENIRDNLSVDGALDYLSRLDDPLNNLGFGAEINSTVSLLESGKIPHFDNAYLLVSDTPEGEFIGEVLKRFWQENPFGYEFSYAEVRKIEKLSDKNPGEFRAKGLRNLVKTMAEIYRAGKDYGIVAVNATGGYKAQIALATALGQALEMPVYYRFERFNHIIEIVPIPLKISTDIVEAYLEMFLMLDCASDGIPKKEFLRYGGWRSFADIPEDIKVFIDEVEGRYVLSPMGQVYLESTDMSYEDISKLRNFYSKADLEISEKEEHAKETLKRYESIVNKILSLKPVSKLKVYGSGEIFTAEKNSVKVVKEGSKIFIRIFLSGSRGNIWMKAMTKCESSQKFHEALAEKIKNILEENL